MISRRLVVAAVAVILSGCVTVAPHQFSVQEVRSWKVIGVEAVLADSASPLWPKVTDEFMERNLPRGPSQTFADTQGGVDRVVVGERPPVTEEVRRAARAHVQAQFAERVRFYMDPLRGTLTGQRPVKVVTTLHGLDVPTFGRQVGVGIAMALVLGPGAQPPGTKMAVSTNVVDAKTGAVLASYPVRTLTRPGGEPVINVGGPDQYGGDAVAAVLRTYAADFNAWLLRS